MTRPLKQPLDWRRRWPMRLRRPKPSSRPRRRKPRPRSDPHRVGHSTHENCRRPASGGPAAVLVLNLEDPTGGGCHSPDTLAAPCAKGEGWGEVVNGSGVRVLVIAENRVRRQLAPEIE